MYIYSNQNRKNYVLAAAKCSDVPMLSCQNTPYRSSEVHVSYIVRTSVARRIQLGAVRLLQTKIAEGSDGIMAKLQYR